MKNIVTSDEIKGVNGGIKIDDPTVGEEIYPDQFDDGMQVYALINGFDNLLLLTVHKNQRDYWIVRADGSHLEPELVAKVRYFRVKPL